MNRAVPGVAILIGALIFILLATAFIDPIVTSITDAAALAVLGSISGGSALTLIIGTVFIALLLLMVVNVMMPATTGGGSDRHGP